MAAGTWLVTWHHSQEAKRGDFWHSVHFLFFTQCEPPAHGMALPSFRVGLPTSVNLN